MSHEYAEIAVPVPLRKTYDYFVPEPLRGALHPGSMVRVPFGRTAQAGYCIGFVDKPKVSEDRLKPITGLLDREVLLAPEVFRLAQWIAEYYFVSLGEALQATLPSSVRHQATLRKTRFISLGISKERAQASAAEMARRAPSRAKLLEALAVFEGPVEAAALLRDAGVGAGALPGLIRDGLVHVEERLLSTTLFQPSAPYQAKILTFDQQAAWQTIERAVDAGAFCPILIHGVTGSGKTELYLRAIERVLARGRSAIVLVPEIALTPQTLERFSGLAPVAVLHSHLTERDRFVQWERIYRGDVRLVIGTRSAIFAPLSDVALIVVDEEHENSYKQETTPYYQGRDVAVVRARNASAVVLLGSATPSLESHANARSGKYRLATLSHRAGALVPPQVILVDMGREMDHQHAAVLFSERLLFFCRQSLSRGEQVILFRNRRGFHTVLRCARCKTEVKCRDCDVPLTYHQGTDELVCHHCVLRRAVPKECAECSFPTLRRIGAGTERIHEAVSACFPDARVAQVDADTMRTAKTLHETLAEFRDGKIDMLVGTQMIAKGLDYPNVTTVGVLHADAGMQLPDFRATERAFQLVMQVCGRCGRSGKGGTAVVQAFDTKHYAIEAAVAQDYAKFAERELENRRKLGYPPFGRLARIVFSGPNASRVEAAAREASQKLSAAGASHNARVLGPVPCPLSRLQAKFRFHTVLKSPTPAGIQKTLAACEAHLARRMQGTLVVVDVDPVNML